MTTELYNPTGQVTSDASGAFTYNAPPPTGSGLYVQVAVAVLNGIGGTFTAKVSGMPWGQWSGAQPFGPITYQGSLTLTITATGLNPNTPYLIQLSGIVDELDELELAIPTALGATALFGSNAFLDVAGVVLGEQQSITYQWFPCAAWGSMRIAARNTGASGHAPIGIEAQWFNAALTRQMATRSWVISPEADGCGYKLEQVLPHLGDMLKIVVSNSTQSG